MYRGAKNHSVAQKIIAWRRDMIYPISWEECMLTKVRLEEVFVAGGEPTITYVARQEQNIQRELARAIASPNQIASLSGPTKTGKTVLCKKVLGDRDYVWIYGGEISSFDELWNKVCAELNTQFQIDEEEETSYRGEIKAGAVITASGSRLSTRKTTTKMKIDSLRSAITELANGKIALVIDDFHYLAPEIRSAFMRSVKGAVFNGLKIILLSVTHRAFDAIRAESELTGRFLSVTVPPWSAYELAKIPELGFAALKVDCPKGIVTSLCVESHESPLLMQKFCWEICYECNIESSNIIGRHIIPADFNLEHLFVRISKDAGQPIYQKLVTGPQSRKSRKKRLLKAGTQVDIYQLVFYALSRTGPKSEVSYDELRDEMSAILAEKLPQKNEVTSAIKHLAKIAMDIGTETAIDWNEDARSVSLMDPYLRFFLRWQVRHSEAALAEA
jgi:hypothetical protein